MLLNILQCIDQPFITKNYMVKNVNSDDAEEPILTYKLRNTTFAYNTVLLYTKLTQFYSCPPPSSLREMHVGSDSHSQPLEPPEMAGPAEDTAQGSRHLSCSGQTQGEGNPGYLCPC